LRTHFYVVFSSAIMEAKLVYTGNKSKAPPINQFVPEQNKLRRIEMQNISRPHPCSCCPRIKQCIGDFTAGHHARSISSEESTQQPLIPVLGTVLPVTQQVLGKALNRDPCLDLPLDIHKLLGQPTPTLHTCTGWWAIKLSLSTSRRNDHGCGIRLQVHWFSSDMKRASNITPDDAKLKPQNLGSDGICQEHRGHSHDCCA
jgi:hypothetical protein